MRTTLTLDADVAAAIEKLRKSRHASLKQIVNEALRRGLLAMERPQRKAKRVSLPTLHLGRCLVPNLDCNADVIAKVEGELWR